MRNGIIRQRPLSLWLIAVLLISGVVVGGVLASYYRTTVGQASGQLDGFIYRKAHVIYSASGAGTNYQIKIIVHYGAGTDNGADVYLNAKCKADFGDIRFTRNDMTTELNYWMQEKVDYDYAVFWVKIPDDLSLSDVTIYIYYGNDSATTTSNGHTTFLFFDDFETGAINMTKWNNNAGSPTIHSESGKKRGNYGVKIDEDNETLSAGFSPTTEHEYAVSYYVYYSNVYEYTYNWFSYTGGFNDMAALGWLRGDGLLLFDPVVDSKYWFINANTLYKIECAGIDFGADNMESIRIDDEERLTYASLHNSASPEQENQITFMNHWTISPKTYIDEVVVRKFASPEPIHGGWGSEETVDVAAPEILSVDWIPTSPYPFVPSSTPRHGEPTLVRANVSEGEGGSGISLVKLSYRIADGEWWNTSMTYNDTAGLWTSTIPGQTGNVTVEFFVTAKDNAGNTATSLTYLFNVKALTIGDINGDGMTDIKDILLAALHYGETTP